ncbi:Gfo/Idh/MocA family protein [Aeromonas veronii]|uniref:Gfo/Idh/MocA family protein n=1 Tax=Aeromonas veronii TaxID=654 RepID=UPI0011179EC0|nr:Gfo/Idh/MocA family oxidoreductase [Aeromonas veronii]TNI05986.1 oxidoreductase [Aeromonas veronii]HDO1309820.1 Gfo/Idh/MocA family oxidoreductase [Aeromonas veronii]
MSILRVAIAGYGKMGKIRGKCILENPSTELVGIYEKDSELVTGVSSNIPVCKSFEELLSLKPDAIFICAFNNVAAEYSIAAMQAGIHVFCEKPPARTCAELSAVMAIEELAGVVLKYGFNHRLHYSVMEAKRIINTGAMGKLLWMRGVYGKAGSIDYGSNWRNYRPYSGGGILLDQGIHMLDLFHHLSGCKFDVISSVLTSSYWDVDVEDNAFVTLKSDRDGVIASLHSSATQWRHKFLLELCFSEGFIILDGILSESRSYTPETLVVSRREFEDITFAMGKPAENTTWYENDDSWRKELDEFISAIKSSSFKFYGTSQDAYDVLSLVESIYNKSGFYEN